MANILYALSGCNRGHTSRVLAITEGLRARSHHVTFCCGGKAREILEGAGEPVLGAPSLMHAMSGNRALYLRTALDSVRDGFKNFGVVSELTRAIDKLAPDLVISDFEAFAARAAERLQIPILSFNHQQVVTETRYPIPLRFALEAFVTRWTIRVVAPRNAVHTLVSSFYFPPLRDPDRTTLVGPVIRTAIRDARPERGRHFLVYFNQGAGSAALLRALEASGERCVVYNIDAPSAGARSGNIVFRKPSLDGFLEDLTTCRGVIATAGYTLMSEALYLGKPLLVAPNGGIFEQTLNGLYLEREGLGKAVYGRDVTAADVRDFARELETYEANLPRRSSGNQHALAVIERVLGAGKAVPTPAARDFAFGPSALLPALAGA